MKEQHTVSLQAEPGPLELDLKRTAIMVIDMQNAFATSGGMFDLWGFDISHIPGVIKNIKSIIDIARTKGIKIIYIAHRLSADLREVGPMSPFYYVNTMFENYRENSEMRDKILLRDTWGSEIIDELRPETTEIVIEKRRYSAFAGTDLDMTLRTFDIKYLIFTGVTTNVCVESSIRDAHHHEYYPILITDASAASPSSRHEASIVNIKQVFGWVTDCNNIMKILSGN